METTIEVRWWADGRLPDEVRAWFSSRAQWKEEDRTDHYLVQPGRSDLGVKTRSWDRLEVKVRTDRKPDVALAAGHGHVEWWRKWSFALAGDPDPAGLEASGDWVALHKHRWLLEWEGCEVELAAVSWPGGSTWWSFGAEADATAVDLPHLTRLLAEVWAVPPPDGMVLVAAASRGYAEQLNRAVGG